MDDLSQPTIPNEKEDKSLDVGGPPNGGLIAWAQVVAAFFIFFNTCIVAGPIYDAGYPRALLFSGTSLTVFGMMMTSIAKKYWESMLAQGVTVGIGCGLLFLPSVVIMSQYFTTKVAFATGVASTGSSLGAVIYPIVFRQLEPGIGFPWAVRTIAFIMLSTSAVSLPFMRRRIPAPHRIRRMYDLAAFTERPYLFCLFGVFFGFMGVYIPFFYAEVYARTVCSSSSDHYLLSIINAGSVFGRLIPNFLADRTGPLNMQIVFGSLAAVLVFSWIAIRNTQGMLAFAVLYGFFSGTFVSLPGPIVVSLSPAHETVGTRMGMALGASGLGLLVGAPVAGAILRSHGGWVGLQAWSGALVVISAVWMLAARVAKVGFPIRAIA
ncbi:MAG: hypothetical protein Q9214_000833 [Letrouitia sp. 1 TL-2023]